MITAKATSIQAAPTPISRAAPKTSAKIVNGLTHSSHSTMISIASATGVNSARTVSRAAGARLPTAAAKTIEKTTTWSTLSSASEAKGFVGMIWSSQSPRLPPAAALGTGSVSMRSAAIAPRATPESRMSGG